MRVAIQAMGSVRTRSFTGQGGTVVELPEGSKVIDALRAVGIADDELWNASVDGQLVEAERVLRDGDVLLVFTPIAGGTA
ncbi:MAG TPA: MoaD/ThiS family protein [bacterium]|nr:MoaD/ThiS family protein [bacterium]